MRFIRQHFSRCIVAGIVALLPIGGFVLMVVYLESQIANSWLKNQGFYFFGLGLVLAAVAIYLMGLVVSTFLGRWIWNSVDRLLDQMPLLGGLYQTLKQILGYGEGPDAVFRRVVMIPSRDLDGDEIGLVTNESPLEGEGQRLTVFVPSAPTPTTGRLVLVDAEKVRPIEMSVSEALKTLVSIGSLPEVTGNMHSVSAG